MKEYMLIYRGGDHEAIENASEEQKAESMKSWHSWMGKLQESEQLVSGGAPLMLSGKNISQDGVVTDISASEVKEIVTGYSIIKAKDTDEAISIAKICPVLSYPGTTLDIREIMQVG